MEHDDSILTSFDVFVCYHETSAGKRYAEIIKKTLFDVLNLRAFVAHIERMNYSHNFDQIRLEVIKKSKYFLFINTKNSLHRNEVMKEFQMLNRYGLDNVSLIVLRHESPKVEFSTEKFKSETGIDLTEITQTPFRDESRLIDAAKNVFKNEKFSPFINKMFARGLDNYLKYCVSTTRRKNPLDSKLLIDTYIPNRKVLVDEDRWHLDEKSLLSEQPREWNFEEFLLNDERYTLIGADFGIGKTSYVFTLVADLASKYIAGKSDVIPIYIPLKNRLKNIDDKGNDLESILTFVPIKYSKILFIFDGLDEYGDKNELSELYDKEIMDKLHYYPNCKIIFTSRLYRGFPDILKVKQCVRLLSFSKDQVNDFYKKYKIPVKYSDLIERGLSSDIISKPLFCWMYAIVYDNIEFNLNMINDKNMTKAILFLLSFIHC